MSSSSHISIRRTSEVRDDASAQFDDAQIRNLRDYLSDSLDQWGESMGQSDQVNAANMFLEFLDDWELRRDGS